MDCNPSQLSELRRSWEGFACLHCTVVPSTSKRTEQIARFIFVFDVLTLLPVYYLEVSRENWSLTPELTALMHLDVMWNSPKLCQGPDPTGLEVALPGAIPSNL